MQNLPLKGFQGTSLIDFPGHIASIVYTGGCNLRCRFCHNPQLLTVSELPGIPVDLILASLTKRRNFIDGVVVSGGEPTIHAALPEFLTAIKSLGLAVKLDTNGTHPEMLRAILADGLADYVAMDYKAPLARLDTVTGIRGAAARVMQSARIIIDHAPTHEFRTTVHPSLLTLEDIETIASEIRGARAFHLQQYHPSDVVDMALNDVPLYDRRFFTAAAGRLSKLFNIFSVRNLAPDTPQNTPHASHAHAHDRASDIIAH